jgi:hypothetical protein
LCIDPFPSRRDKVPEEKVSGQHVLQQEVGRNTVSGHDRIQDKIQDVEYVGDFLTLRYIRLRAMVAAREVRLILKAARAYRKRPPYG